MCELKCWHKLRVCVFACAEHVYIFSRVCKTHACGSKYVREPHVFCVNTCVREYMCAVTLSWQVCHDHVCVNLCAWQGVRARKCVLCHKYSMCKGINCVVQICELSHGGKDVRVKLDLCESGRVHK